jgi:hypothetical protein
MKLYKKFFLFNFFYKESFFYYYELVILINWVDNKYYNFFNFVETCLTSW